MAYNDSKQAISVLLSNILFYKMLLSKVALKLKKKMTLKETYCVFPKLVLHQMLCTYT